VSEPELQTSAVGPESLADVAVLFEGYRNTRRCWCMAPCTTGARFAAGWLTGGNRRLFESLAREGDAPMGVLARLSGEPVGWAACGPRSRYAGREGHRRTLLRGLDPLEDHRVWLLPCLFVRADQRGRGLTRTLVQAAVGLARDGGASAIEGWPLAGPDPAAADAFLGRESTFGALGFRRVAQPDPRRVIMRLDLAEREASP
jgi:GNAT superfamily N-acetyltransferase